MKYLLCLILTTLSCSICVQAADSSKFSASVLQRLSQIKRLEASADPTNVESPLMKTLGALETMAKNTIRGSEGEMAVNEAANKVIQRIKARARHLSLHPDYRVRLNVLFALSIDNNIQPIGSTSMNYSAEDRKLILSMAFDPHVKVRRRAVNMLYSLYEHDKAHSLMPARASFSEAIVAAMAAVREKESNAEIQEIAENFFDEVSDVPHCGFILGED